MNSNRVYSSTEMSTIIEGHLECYRNFPHSDISLFIQHCSLCSFFFQSSSKVQVVLLRENLITASFPRCCHKNDLKCISQLWLRRKAKSRPWVSHAENTLVKYHPKKRRLYTDYIYQAINIYKWKYINKTINLQSEVISVLGSVVFLVQTSWKVQRSLLCHRSGKIITVQYSCSSCFFSAEWNIFWPKKSKQSTAVMSVLRKLEQTPREQFVPKPVQVLNCWLNISGN